MMSAVKNKNTTAELKVRSALHKAGFRFRLHRKELPGTPDVFLPKYRTALQVHGCFWHGHKSCSRSKLPKTRQKFWHDKIKKNKERDKRTHAALERAGFRVFTIWECQTKTRDRLEGVVEQFQEFVER
jgi:DNA mismatch endonuclease (patch repair protein)